MAKDPKPKKAPTTGQCPHCERRKQVLTRGYAVPTMDGHNYTLPVPKNAPKGTRGKVVHCPGSGRRCKPGTEK